MSDLVLSLLQLVRRRRLLAPEQLNEVKRAWLPGLADPTELADRLVRRGWLTAYQAEQLLDGRDEALVLGPYRLLGLVGEGALGQVFRARHRDHRTVVALKVLRPELRSEGEVLRQFWQEADALASLDHPAFVCAFDTEPDHDCPYFAMEYVEGIDLGRLLRLAGPLPTAQACDYARQAALGLQYAFEHGLVHRDIKPPNLLVCFAEGRVRVLDIGSARREWRPAGGKGGGALMGTADYIAPEQALTPQAADTRADVYSLGCTLYHLLTGRPPFPGASVARKLLDHQQAPVPSVREARPELPPALDAVVQRMLQKQPGDRYQTPALAAVAIAPFCEGDSPRLDLERFRAPAEASDTLRAGQDPDTFVEAPPACPAAPRPAPDGAGFMEQRRDPRRAGNLVRVVVAGALHREEPIRGFVLDRSPGGLGLSLPEAVEVDTVVRVRPDGLAHGPDKWHAVRVIHCHRDRVRWRVGCQFLERLAWADLRAFG
jgi:hypothetical protein